MADTENLALFTESARRALVDVSPVKEMRDRLCISESLARQTWQTAVQLGWTGLGISEQFDGLDLGIEFLCALGFETGRSLAAGPFATNLALMPALASQPGGAAFREVLPSIISGEVVLTDCASIARSDDPAARQITPDQGPVSLDCGVIDHAVVASHVLWMLVSPTDQSAAVTAAVIDLSAPGVDLQDTPLFDPTSRGGRLLLREVTIDPVRHCAFTMNLEELDRIFVPVRLFIAAQAVGVAQRALEVAIEHVCNRQQFGQPLGAFQAIKHQLADLHLANEKARVLTQFAARAHEEGKSNALLDAHSAWLAATRAAVGASQTCLQLHGAIGFSWEHPCHLLLKRARSLATRFVGVLESRRFIATTIARRGQLLEFDDLSRAVQPEGA